MPKCYFVVENLIAFQNPHKFDASFGSYLSKMATTESCLPSIHTLVWSPPLESGLALCLAFQRIN